MANFLDLTPMLRAIRERPGEFDMREGGDLHHLPSRHLVKFDPQGNARIYARCECSQLTVRREQSLEMQEAFQIWTEAYWKPLQARRAAERRVAEINRQFAAHFRPPGRWWRLLASLRAHLLGSQFAVDSDLPEDWDLVRRVPSPRAAASALRSERSLRLSSAQGWHGIPCRPSEAMSKGVDSGPTFID